MKYLAVPPDIKLTFMMTKYSTFIGFIVVSLFLMFNAYGATYQHLLPSKSQITFSYHQFHIPLQGRFTTFKGNYYFDTTHLDDSYIYLGISVASIETGSSQANHQSQSDVWLDTKAYPVAYFYSTHIRPIDQTHVEVEGVLSIKDHAEQIAFPVQLAEHGDTVTMQGTFTFKRQDFALGVANQGGDHMLSNAINVSFNLAAD